MKGEKQFDLNMEMFQYSGGKIYPVYRKCRACRGTGSIQGMNEIMTTAGWQSFSYTCVICNGTGKEETEYFVEL